jgi:hypothetical protein
MEAKFNKNKGCKVCSSPKGLRHTQNSNKVDGGSTQQRQSGTLITRLAFSPQGLAISGAAAIGTTIHKFSNRPCPR